MQITTRLGLAVALVALVALTVLGGCPKERTAPGGGAAIGPPAVADAAAGDTWAGSMPVYRKAAVQIVSDQVAPAPLTWNHRLLTERDLDDAVEDGSSRTLGRFVVLLESGRLEPYDAKAGTLAYVGPGLRGIAMDPPASFAADPSVTRGELPLGGHARLDLGYLPGTIAVDAAAAQALIDADDKDPLVMHMLVELIGPGEVDGADVILGTLVGVRVVRQGAREVYLEGTPTGLGRP